VKESGLKTDRSALGSKAVDRC